MLSEQFELFDENNNSNKPAQKTRRKVELCLGNREGINARNMKPRTRQELLDDYDKQREEISIFLTKNPKILTEISNIDIGNSKNHKNLDMALKKAIREFLHTLSISDEMFINKFVKYIKQDPRFNKFCLVCSSLDNSIAGARGDVASKNSPARETAETTSSQRIDTSEMALFFGIEGVSDENDTRKRFDEDMSSQSKEILEIVIKEIARSIYPSLYPNPEGYPEIEKQVLNELVLKALSGDELVDNYEQVMAVVRKYVKQVVEEKPEDFNSDKTYVNILLRKINEQCKIRN